MAAWAGMGWAGWAGLADWLLGWLDAGSFVIKSRLGEGRWSLNRDLESQGHKVIKSSGTDFVDSWSQDQKAIKSKLLGVILSTSGAKARQNIESKLLRRLLCRLLEPGPESHQLETSGIDFVDFWGQGHKVIKSLLLGLMMSTYDANARKSSNRS